MKKTITIQTLLQSVFNKENVQQIAQKAGYDDTATDFTVFKLLQYWTQAAHGQWEGYRSGADFAKADGLGSFHYSTFSKKAADVPFAVFISLFRELLSRGGRALKRRLSADKSLLLVDSTTITVGKGRLPWAPFHGERAGVKLHVALDAASKQPIQVVETAASRHDGPVGEQLENADFTLVMDRAYGKIARFDRYVSENQPFVVRLKDNVQLTVKRGLKRMKVPDSPVIQDFTCLLGTMQCRSEKRHRVVIFRDNEGRKIRVATNRKDVTGEQIADMYRARWGIEVFFRWMKQHLNVPVLFGRTRNAVYGQLYAALIVYVLLQGVFSDVSERRKIDSLTFARFSRLLYLDLLPKSWKEQVRRWCRLEGRIEWGIHNGNA